jgi:hypothetical protein
MITQNTVVAQGLMFRYVIIITNFANAYLRKAMYSYTCKAMSPCKLSVLPEASSIANQCNSRRPYARGIVRTVGLPF